MDWTHQSHANSLHQEASLLPLTRNTRYVGTPDRGGPIQRNACVRWKKLAVCAQVRCYARKALSIWPAKRPVGRFHSNGIEAALNSVLGIVGYSASWFCGKSPIVQTARAQLSREGCEGPSALGSFRCARKRGRKKAVRQVSFRLGGSTVVAWRSMKFIIVERFSDYVP